MDGPDGHSSSGTVSYPDPSSGTCVEEVSGAGAVGSGPVTHPCMSCGPSKLWTSLQRRGPEPLASGQFVEVS